MDNKTQMTIQKWTHRLCVWLLFCVIAAAQVQIPAGTGLRVRLDEDLSSATAQEGQLVRLSVVDEVKVGGTVVIAPGAAVAGSVIEAVPRKMTSSGKLDFSVLSVMAADGQPIPLRYIQDRAAAGNSVTSGIIGAGATILFGPSVTMLRMMRAKEITLQAGTILEVFTDQNHAFQPPASAAAAGPTTAAPASSANKEEAGTSEAVKLAILSITATPDGAKITVDGTEMGEAPASFQIDPGAHAVQIEKEGFAIWKRNVTVKEGISIDLDVKLEKPSEALSKAKPAPKPVAKSAGAVRKSAAGH
jgi:PEGA domain-containing protein